MTLSIPKIELTENNALIFTAYFPSMKVNVKELWTILSKTEKVQTEKFATYSLKEKYILSHGILRYILAEYLDKDPQDIDYSTNLYGKPFLKDGSNIQFNMSHSKNYAVYIIAHNFIVGIDVEWQDKNINIQEVAEFLLSPTENLIFNQLELEEKFLTFYKVWTKKEAIIKAIGQGLSYPLKAIEVLTSFKRNKSYYITSGHTIYYTTLNNLNNYYTGAVALSQKPNKLIHINL